MNRTVLRSARIPDAPDPVSVVVEGGRIAEVGEVATTDNDVIIDVGGRAVLPAFADLHIHLDKAGLYWHDDQASADEIDRLRWASDRTIRLKERMSVSSIIERATDVARAMARRGTTAMRTHVDVDTVIGLRGVEALLEVRDRLRDEIDLQVSVLPTESGWHHGGPGMNLVQAALKLDVDAIGGATGFVDDPEFYVPTVFDLAEQAGVAVDLHVDESDDPGLLVLEDVARLTLERQMVGRVVAGHCSTLSLASAEDAQRVIDLVVQAQVTIVAMPMTNLYLLGGPRGPRGMTRLKDLLRSGALLACASDNQQDAFTPYGNGDLLQVAALAGIVGQVGSPREQQQLIASITEVPRAALGTAPGVVEVGGGGDLVVLDTLDPARVLAVQPPVHMVIRSGRVQSASATYEDVGSAR